MNSKWIHWHAQSVSGIQIAQILEPICGFASPNPRELLTGHRRFLSQHPHQEIDDPEPFPPPFIGCRVCNTHRFLLSYLAYSIFRRHRNESLLQS